MPTLTELIEEEPLILRKFISEDNGDIKVNWKAIDDYEKDNNQNERLKILDRIYLLLIRLEILSTESERNYLLTDGDFVLNPARPPYASLYFTRLNDVKEYEEQLYSNKMISTDIFQGVKDPTSS